MKHTFAIISLICLLLSPVAASAHTYSTRSVLQSGRFVKIRVSDTGLAYLTYEDLQKAGLNPAQVRIYGYGGAMLSQNFTQPKIDDLPAVPYYQYTGADGVFGAGDYIIFYAQGPVKWSYNGSRFTHTKNTYSNYGYYFLSDDAGEQELITIRSSSLTPTSTSTTYTAHFLHEIDSINVLGAANGGGQEFYEPITSRNISFPFADIVTTENITIYFDAAAYSPINSQFRLTLNGKQVKSSWIQSIPTNDFYTKANRTTGTYTFPATDAAKQTILVEYTATNAGAFGYLNYLEATATCNLHFAGRPLPFRYVKNYGKTGATALLLSGATAETQIWNVSDLSDIHAVATTTEGDALRIISSNASLQEFIAFTPTSTTGMMHATVVGSVPNQDLHALQNVDMIIITPEAFKSAADRLALAHEAEGLVTEVVTDQEVYNEFSSGTPDASAYRWLMKMLYDRHLSDPSIEAPKHLLLMGDGTFDNRKLLPNSGQNHLLTYQAINSLVETDAYAADDYFTYLDDNAGQTDYDIKRSSKMRIGVGRFPVNSLEEANAMVDKTIHYLQDHQGGSWHNELCFLADDGDGNEHTKASDMVASSIHASDPRLIINKIYLDAYSQEIGANGEAYPLAENMFTNFLQRGQLYMNYAGHGGIDGITSEKIITNMKLRQMMNQNQALWFLATCNFSHWDAGVTSAGELAVLNPDGGALAVISACRTVYAAPNSALNKLFCDTLFAHHGGYHMTIGDALRSAKNQRGDDKNKMPYTLLGDPAIRLHYPGNATIHTTSSVDTIRAMSLQQIEGEIWDEGALATWFNGPINVRIWDKERDITTLDNDQTDESKKVKYTYKDYPNTIFSGQTQVVDGRFSFTFMVPKDIRYNYGPGRIVYYAYDTLTHEEATGLYTDFLIGGSSTVTIVDTVGPQMQLYLDRPSFQDGGKTGERPHLYVELEDEHGINTSGSGIGHDILLTIDNDANRIYTLNDYYTAEENSFRRGTISYILQEQTEGQHSLSVRAWDLLNNSTTRSLSFQVVKGYDPEIYSVLTYPNPVGLMDELHIVLDYNQTDVPVDATISIYDLSGKLIYRFYEKNATTIHWNLADAHVRAGVYIYNVALSTPTSGVARKSGKIIVTE